MKSSLLAGLLAVGYMFTAACSKDIQNPDAVRQAVIDDVKARAAQTGLNPDAMDVSVSSVSFATDQAHATVAFTPKGAPQGGGMSMDYVLARDGSKWKVTDRQMARPPGSAPAQPDLPAGHPAVGNPQ